MDTTEHVDVVVVGAGLAGLTSSYYLKKNKPDLRIVVIERSGTAGGLTGNWIDHRFGADKKLQYPMHMIFRDKYANLVRLVDEIGGTFSPLYSGFNILSSNGKRHRLEMTGWTAEHLPPPLHALGTFAKMDMPLSAKWDLIKLILASLYCAKSLLSGLQEPAYAPNTLSLEGLELLLNMGPEARDFIEAATPSIYNPHPWYTSAPRMASILAGTLAMERNSLHYHVFSKSYNAAFIDDFVVTLKKMGVEFRFFTEARRIDVDAEGERAQAVWYQTAGPETEQAKRYVCQNCGAENYTLDRAFCTRCGLDTTLTKIRQGIIARPVDRELWIDPAGNGCRKISCDTLVTAMYPHMIARLLPIDSPARRQPYLRSCFSARGNQTQLSIGRVYYRKQVTRGETFITGTHNPHYAFNGCQSVLNNFGAADLGYDGGDVVDVLLDVGVIRDAHTPKVQIERIVHDLQRVYPDADPSLVEHVSFADIYPEVLYLTEQPAIAGLHRMFNTRRTGIRNWYVAGCHSGLIGIGMESAVQSAMAAVTCYFEDAGSEPRIDIIPLKLHGLSKAMAHAGAALLWWKTGGRRVNRLAGTTYSMPPGSAP